MLVRDPIKSAKKLKIALCAVLKKKNPDLETAPGLILFHEVTVGLTPHILNTIKNKKKE